MLDEEWGLSKFDFYTPRGAERLARFFKSWQGGKLVVSIAEMPIKCPVAPLKFLFLADAYFTPCLRNGNSRAPILPTRFIQKPKGQGTSASAR